MSGARFFGLAAAILFAVAPNAMAAMNKLDATKITCQDFSSRSQDQQRRILAFLTGYTQKDLSEDSLGETQVDSDTAHVDSLCAKDPDATVLQQVEKSSGQRDSGTAQKHPGMNEARPMKITCEEFERLDRDTQTDLVYWLEGWGQKKGSSKVDLDADPSSIAASCKSTPKQTLRSAVHSEGRSKRESNALTPARVAQAGGGAGGGSGGSGAPGSGGDMGTNPGPTTPPTTMPGTPSRGGVGPNGEALPGDPNMTPPEPDDPNYMPRNDPNTQVEPNRPGERGPGTMGDPNYPNPNNGMEPNYPQ